MKPTMRDVAKAAGVSAMAVSSVLHGTGRNVRVSAETAERIFEAARELKYFPNNFARSLRNGKTRTVGVVFQHFQRLGEDNPYYPQLLNGVMAALFPADYTLALCPKLVTGGDIGAMLDGRFDGVLWARPDFTEAKLESLRDTTVPLVMMHAPPGTVEGIPTFCADNQSALRLAVDHLHSLGHHKCAFFIDEVNDHTAEGRVRGESFLQAIQENRMVGEVFTWDERPRSFQDFRQSHLDTTAYLCFSDTLAGQLLSVCKTSGISVPRDVSVVGFDSSSFCERTEPRLTSVFQPVEKIAFEATSYLLKLIDANDREEQLMPTSTIYSCGLDIRESMREVIPFQRSQIDLTTPDPPKK